MTTRCDTEAPMSSQDLDALLAELHVRLKRARSHRSRRAQAARRRRTRHRARAGERRRERRCAASPSRRWPCGSRPIIRRWPGCCARSWTRSARPESSASVKTRLCRAPLARRLAACQRQTRREAGTQSYRSHEDSGVAAMEPIPTPPNPFVDATGAFVMPAVRRVVLPARRLDDLPAREPRAGHCRVSSA